jgi:hypothetical protein
LERYLLYQLLCYSWIPWSFEPLDFWKTLKCFLGQLAHTDPV